YIILPHDYPNAAPELYIHTKMLFFFFYNFCTNTRTFLLEKSQSTDAVDHPKVRNMTTEMEDDEEIMLPDNWVLKLNTESVHLFENHSIDEELPPIKQGGMITDRRSTFQPQPPTVVTPRQLLQPSTTCLPFYCLYCRTYCEDKQSFLQDREDDGDTAAGGQLLHLLQVLFSVRWLSRWYGGILLGPDHFKHINNSARNILVQEGYTSSAVRPSLPISNVSKFGTSPH
uniref:Impact N-terminal domain-containing protein n=1 Tax=Oncorhynchus mykiss TaxID=8022 RepID=A0A8C7T0J6_ONCMY